MIQQLAIRISPTTVGDQSNANSLRPEVEALRSSLLATKSAATTLGEGANLYLYTKTCACTTVYSHLVLEGEVSGFVNLKAKPKSLERL